MCMHTHIFIVINKDSATNFSPHLKKEFNYKKKFTVFVKDRFSPTLVHCHEIIHKLLIETKFNF